MSNVREVPASKPPMPSMPPTATESRALAGLPPVPDELDALRQIAALFALLDEAAAGRVARYVASRWGGAP